MPNSIGLLSANRDEMRETPRKNKLLGLLADALSAANEYAQRPDAAMPGGRANPMLGLLADASALPSAATTAQRASYGEPLTNGLRGAKAFLKPETADIAMMAPISPRNALAALGMVGGMADNGAVQAMSFASRRKNVFNALPPELIAKAQAEMAALKSATINSPAGGAASVASDAPFATVLFGGKPKTFYHGTSGNHMSLSDSYQGDVSSGAGIGHWFSHEPRYAWEYAENAAGARGGEPRLVRANLSARNTLEVRFNGAGKPTINGLPVDFEDNAGVLRYAKQKGFDSVNFPDGSFTDDPSFVVLRGDQARFID